MNDRLWNRSLLFTAVLVALIASASIGLTWRAAPDAASRFSLVAYSPAFAAALASYALRTLRFYYFLRTSGIAISFHRTLAVQLVGFALAVTPGRVGEVFKLHLVRERVGTPVVQSAPLLLLDRLTEGGGFFVLAIASALLLPSFEDDIPSSRLLLLGLLTMILFALTRSRWQPSAGIVAAWLANSRLGQQFMPHLQNLWRGLETSFTTRQIAGGVGLSVLARSADGLAVFFIAQMLGVKLALPAAVFVLAVGGLAGGASFLPAGIGAVEATMTGILVLMGTSLPNAVAIALFTRLLILWLWVALGLVFAIALRWPSFRAQRSIDPEL